MLVFCKKQIKALDSGATFAGSMSTKTFAVVVDFDIAVATPDDERCRTLENGARCIVLMQPKTGTVTNGIAAAIVS